MYVKGFGAHCQSVTLFGLAREELISAQQNAESSSGRHVRQTLLLTPAEHLIHMKSSKETEAKRLQFQLSETQIDKSVMIEKMNWIGKNVMAMIETKNKVMRDLAELNQRLDDVAKQTTTKPVAPTQDEKTVPATQVATLDKGDG